MIYFRYSTNLNHFKGEIPDSQIFSNFKTIASDFATFIIDFAAVIPDL